MRRFFGGGKNKPGNRLMEENPKVMQAKLEGDLQRDDKLRDQLDDDLESGKINLISATRIMLGILQRDHERVKSLFLEANAESIEKNKAKALEICDKLVAQYAILEVYGSVDPDLETLIEKLEVTGKQADLENDNRLRDGLDHDLDSGKITSLSATRIMLGILQRDQERVKSLFLETNAESIEENKAKASQICDKLVAEYKIEDDIYQPVDIGTLSNSITRLEDTILQAEPIEQERQASGVQSGAVYEEPDNVAARYRAAEEIAQNYEHPEAVRDALFEESMQSSSNASIPFEKEYGAIPVPVYGSDAAYDTVVSGLYGDPDAGDIYGSDALFSGASSPGEAKPVGLSFDETYEAAQGMAPPVTSIEAKPDQDRPPVPSRAAIPARLLEGLGVQPVTRADEAVGLSFDETYEAAQGMAPPVTSIEAKPDQDRPPEVKRGNKPARLLEGLRGQPVTQANEAGADGDAMENYDSLLITGGGTGPVVDLSELPPPDKSLLNEMDVAPAVPERDYGREEDLYGVPEASESSTDRTVDKQEDLLAKTYYDYWFSDFAKNPEQFVDNTKVQSSAINDLVDIIKQSISGHVAQYQSDQTMFDGDKFNDVLQSFSNDIKDAMREKDESQFFDASGSLNVGNVELIVKASMDAAYQSHDIAGYSQDLADSPDPLDLSSNSSSPGSEASYLPSFANELAAQLALRESRSTAATPPVTQQLESPAEKMGYLQNDMGFNITQCTDSGAAMQLIKGNMKKPEFANFYGSQIIEVADDFNEFDMSIRDAYNLVSSVNEELTTDGEEIDMDAFEEDFFQSLKDLYKELQRSANEAKAVKVADEDAVIAPIPKKPPLAPKPVGIEIKGAPPKSTKKTGNVAQLAQMFSGRDESSRA